VDGDQVLEAHQLLIAQQLLQTAAARSGQPLIEHASAMAMNERFAPMYWRKTSSNIALTQPT